MSSEEFKQPVHRRSPIPVFRPWPIVIVVIIIAVATISSGRKRRSQMRHRRNHQQNVINQLYYLRPRVMSQVHNGRSSRVELEFASNSELTDSNTSRLVVLNQMPYDNWVALTISTPSVTDRSISQLRRLHAIDELKLQRSGLTDEGIRQLARSMNCRVFHRTPADKRFVERREQLKD